jgi:ADP-ribosylglycohydrolase
MRLITCSILGLLVTLTAVALSHTVSHSYVVTDPVIVHSEDMSAVSTVRSRARNALLGVFVADAASLGLHWVYDQAAVQTKINNANGGVAEFTDAIAVENPWHKKVTRGDLSHYGDHAKVALESMVESKAIDSADIRAKYLSYFGSPKYERYLDHATKEFIKSGGAAGVADNQDGAIAKAAAVAVYTALKSDAEFERLAVEAVETTHNDPTDASALPYAVASTWIIRKIIKDGVTIAEAVAALKDYAKTSPVAGVSSKIPAAIEKVESKLNEQTAEVFGKETGQHCRMTSSWLVALRALLDAGSNSFENVVRKEIYIAGDTSGRLLFSGAAAGAAYGVPSDWLDKVNVKNEIVDLVDRWLEISEITE